MFTAAVPLAVRSTSSHFPRQRHARIVTAQSVTAAAFSAPPTGRATSQHRQLYHLTSRSKKQKKGDGLKYIAYFQSFTGTHGDLDFLERIYTQAAKHPDIVGLSIATRPDCLNADALAMLGRLSQQKPLWVELGLQTIHEETAKRINRCYCLDVYDRAMDELKKLSIHRITHVILGLPGESRRDMLETIDYVGQRTDGIKLQLLHVIEGTALAESYRKGEFEVLGSQEYYQIVADALKILPDSVVIHRLTGDGAKKDLLAPLWSADKKKVMNDMNRVLRQNGIYPVL